jgi:hypothetical protein
MAGGNSGGGKRARKRPQRMGEKRENKVLRLEQRKRGRHTFHSGHIGPGGRRDNGAAYRDKAHIHDVSQNHTGYDGENVS